MSVLKKVVLFLGDIGALYATLAATLLIRYGTGAFSDAFRTHLGPFSVIFLVWLLVLYLADLYRPGTLRSNASIVATLSLAVLTSGVISAVCFYLFGDFFALTPKTNLLIFVAVFFVVDAGWRALTRRRFAAGAENVIIIGDSPRARELTSYLSENPHAGYRVALSVTKETGTPAAGLADAARAHRVTTVVVPGNMGEADPAMRSAVYHLLPLELTVISVADFYELIFERTPLGEVSESWFIQNITTRRPFYDSAKRLADLLLAAVVLIAFSPFALLSALAIALSSPGPVVYQQERTGKNGRPFTLYKFRTMLSGAGGALWTERNDSRITPIGRVLRFTHLDEVPQLWNIIRGDISFIGPRPERCELVREFSRLPYYEMRHVVKPGLTGWAQINYRPSASLEEAYEKLTYDIYYIKNRSLFLDLMIVLKTVRHFFFSH